MPEEELVELLADESHASWSRWMKWLFSISVTNADGSVTITPSLVERWQRQMNTPYSQLSESEKESDRNEARRDVLIVQSYLEFHT